MARKIIVQFPDDHELFDLPNPELPRKRGKRWKGDTKAFLVRMDAETCVHLDRLAALHGVTRSEWVRQAIEFRVAAEYAKLDKRRS